MQYSIKCAKAISNVSGIIFYDLQNRGFTVTDNQTIDLGDNFDFYKFQLSVNKRLTV